MAFGFKGFIEMMTHGRAEKARLSNRTGRHMASKASVLTYHHKVTQTRRLLEEWGVGSGVEKPREFVNISRQRLAGGEDVLEASLPDLVPSCRGRGN